MIQLERIQNLNSKLEQPGEYVLYWMQASVRSRYNHALEHAIEHANRLGQPLYVFFGLTPNYPEANLRSYTFLLEGLQAIKQGLERRQIPLVVRLGHPPDLALELAKKASRVVTDRGYVRVSRAWREQLAQKLECPLEQVESDAVVPVETASNKAEVGARTLRPRIHRLWKNYLVALKERTLENPGNPLESLDLSSIPALLEQLGPDPSVTPSPLYKGGELEAHTYLEKFMQEGLEKYVEGRGGPLSSVSNLSPYLHYGHSSPLEVALALEDRIGPAADAFLEELIVRRELSFNFCFFNTHYDSFEGLPNWAKKTMEKHAEDPRPFIYTLEQLENAHTHDPYWNAAQLEMVKTGKMANYMRMYWGKKVIEWTRGHAQAFEWLLYLNNKYELDGRNPNSYAGIAWCFGQHDRPWGERPIFGNLRYMVSSGLERKFKMSKYVEWVAGL